MKRLQNLATGQAIIRTFLGFMETFVATYVVWKWILVPTFGLPAFTVLEVFAIVFLAYRVRAFLRGKS